MAKVSAVCVNCARCVLQVITDCWLKTVKNEASQHDTTCLADGPYLSHISVGLDERSHHLGVPGQNRYEERREATLRITQLLRSVLK